MVISRTFNFKKALSTTHKNSSIATVLRTGRPPRSSSKFKPSTAKLNSVNLRSLQTNFTKFQKKPTKKLFKPAFQGAIKINPVRTSLDAFAKSKSLNIAGKRPTSIFKTKQNQISKNNQSIQNRIKISTLAGFASAVKNNDDLRGFDDDIFSILQGEPTSFNENETSRQDNQQKETSDNNFDIVGYLDNIFNDKKESELPPQIPDSPIDSFFDFFSAGFEAGSSVSGIVNEVQSSPLQDTAFVTDLGFPTNSSEDDNPNLRPDIRISGLGGVTGETNPDGESADDGKGFIEKIIDNPILLGLIGVGILVMATRGKR